MKTTNEVLAAAQERTGLGEIDSDSWREGLEILLTEAARSPNVTPQGQKILEEDYVRALANRLRVHRYVQDHPEVLEEKIERPLVILGLPRTGTTVASYLLDQDPQRRSLLNWEADDSVPPPTTATLRTDPRCLAKGEQLNKMAGMLIQAGIHVPHWEDADGPTECIFVQAQDFKAFSLESSSPTSTYSDWLLERADMTSAYQYEKRVLQVLQSQAPGIWSLKMPSHAVHIETLLTTFPDVRMIWAHRDPYKATTSLCSILAMGKARVTGGGIGGGGNYDKLELGRNTMKQVKAHVDRAMRARARIGDHRFYDLHYANLMRDPVGEMRKIYKWAGDSLSPAVEERMNQWLKARPQDRFGKHKYTLEEYGLSREKLEPIFADYLAKFNIEMEG
jgi:Sulfotransferase family